MSPTRDDYRDAVGWLHASARGDGSARNELAMLTDPVGLIDALTDLALGLATIATGGHPWLYLNHIREHIEEYVDEAEKHQR